MISFLPFFSLPFNPRDRARPSSEYIALVGCLLVSSCMTKRLVECLGFVECFGFVV